MRAKLGNPAFNYEIACNQICGRGHYAMKMNIIVDEPDDYQNWYAAQKSFTELNPEVMAALKQKGPAAAAAQTAAPVEAEVPTAPLAQMAH